MLKQLSSNWYKNGEDIFFEEEAFHQLAYQITYTYQKYMAAMEQKHDGQMSYLLARKAGWEYEPVISPGSFSQLFKIPGYRLEVIRNTDTGGYGLSGNQGSAVIMQP